jgi:signal transduction histidine kinase
VNQPSIRARTISAFSAALILLLLIGVVSYYKISALATNNEWVIHTYQVREAIQELVSNLTIARSEARAYLATHDQTHVRGYRSRSEAVTASFNQTIALTRDNPAEQQRLNQLQPTLVKVFGLLDQETANRPPSDQQIANLFTAVQIEMDKAQTITSEMMEEEGRLLDERNGEARASSRVVLSVVLIGAVLAFVVIIASMWNINRALTEKQVADERIAGLNSALSSRAEELAQANEHLQRQAEELARANSDLAATNRELEAFTYSVSHDLRAPLRQMHGFSRILHEEFSAQLPEEAQRYLNRVREGAVRMGCLVDDLLAFARIGRKELTLQLVGITGIVNSVLDDLQSDAEGRAVEWRIAELPFVECDPQLVKQVFANLLSNALKYSRPRQPAVIEVGHSAKNGAQTFFVRDNGVGFSMRHADKLFGVFQRLHRPEDFEGTGIGLATVQRIVHKHGGKIWVEAEIDKGATFFFNLQPAESLPEQAKGAAT